MRISIHTLGTRGDVQPYLALALGLKTAGHDVLIAAPTQYEAFIAARGVAFAHLPGEFLELMNSPEAKAAMAGSAGFTAGFKMIKHFKPIGRKQLTAEWQAARDFRPELIIYHPKAIASPHIAEKLGCRGCAGLTACRGSRRHEEFASPMVPFRSVGPFNRMTHSFMAEAGDAIFRKMIGEWRASELGLSKKPGRKLRPNATLYAYSPTCCRFPPTGPTMSR